MTLRHDPNIADPDGFYEELVAQLRGLDDEQAEAFQARMLLLLANHVGDRGVLSEAMRVARQGLSSPESFSSSESETSHPLPGPASVRS